tara:strand:+ start:122 stop:2260 length:2139 start_codon:yes stop_codon:yes gene_type:complete
MALPDNGDFSQSGSIISRWKLDESSGTREDSVGSNDLTDNNTVTGATGKFGVSASAFARASTEYLSISDNASLSPVGDISYFAWIKPTTTPDDNAYAIASKYDDADRSWYFDYSEDGGGERLHFYVRDSNGDSTSPEVAVTLANDTWHQVGFVYDVSAFEVKFYVNGVQVGATGSTAGVNDLRDSAGDFRIGAMDNAGIANLWDGLMQDAIFWDVELTAAEVAANYNLYGTGLPATAALPQSGSITARWKLDEPSGTRADSVGSNDLTDNNTVTAEGAQFNNIAAVFELDNSENLSIADNADMSQTGDMSYFVWVQFETHTMADSRLMDKLLSAGDHRSYYFAMTTNGTQLRYGNYSNGQSGSDNDILRNFTPTDGAWYHMGFVYDASAGEAKLFINGAQLGATDTGMNTSVYDGDADFTIGGASAFHDGLMQDAIMWGAELTDAEVEDLYNAYFNLPDEGDLPQPGSVVARHTLTEGGGTRNDQVGTNHLTDNNTVTSTTGISETNSSAERAADFNDSNSEYLTVADNANISITGDMSWFAWVRPDTALQGSSDSYFLASKYDHTQRSWYIAYALEDTNEQVDVYIADNLTGDANSKREIWDVTLAIGQWYHMGFVYDASDGEVGFYIDGAQVDTIRTGFATDIVDGTAAYRIGAFSGGGGTTGFWPGQVQDAIMWNAELTGAEVTTLYELYTVEPSTGTPSGLALLGVGN